MPQQTWTRRSLLQTGALSIGALGAGGFAKGARPGSARSCIFLMLVGGPSQLDTWDPKPDAPTGVRGDTRAIRTNVPGILISEHFPRMARQADQYALVRGCYHQAAAVHDTGHQLVQTGHVFEDGAEYPHIGCVVSSEIGRNSHVLLGGPIGLTGGNMPHGQTAGPLGSAFEPVSPSPRQLAVGSEPASVSEAYGAHPFSRDCLAARRLVESGVRFVTVNMFQTVFDTPTWDVHGTQPFTTMRAHRELVCPVFDRAYSALLNDLSDRGLLETTLVVASGEFGRSPRINAAGGRDHWPQCWTMLVTGGGVRGGQVVGASDHIGGEPRERPVTPGEIIATISHAMGLHGQITTDSPIHELFS